MVRKSGPSPDFEPLNVQPAESLYADWAIPADWRSRLFRECMQNRVPLARQFWIYRASLRCSLNLPRLISLLTWSTVPHFAAHLIQCRPVLKIMSLTLRNKRPVSLIIISNSVHCKPPDTQARFLKYSSLQFFFKLLLTVYCHPHKHLNVFTAVVTGDRLQLKCDGTRWHTGGEVKGKLASVVCSQYP